MNATNEYLKTRNLESLDALARVYAKNYASPHYITFTVEGLRNMLKDKALNEPQPKPKLKANPMLCVLTEGIFNSKFKPGDLVQKKSGSKWRGRIVGYYSTDLTKVGWAVESIHEPGSVQIYPESALDFIMEETQLVDEDVALVLAAWDFSQFDKDNLRAVQTSVVEALHRVFGKLMNGTLLLAPHVNAKFTIETPSGMEKYPTLTGTRYVPVKGLEREDDGSVTVDLDYWPDAKYAESATRQSTLIDQLETELKVAKQRIAELEQALNSAHAPTKVKYPTHLPVRYKLPPKKP